MRTHERTKSCLDAVRSVGALVLFVCASLALRAATDSDTPATPQQLYNQGTQKFREGKLREAESTLQLAVVSQNEKVQVPALYNLGHVRFQEGVQELKGGPGGKASAAVADRACETGSAALAAADEALGKWYLQNSDA